MIKLVSSVLQTIPAPEKKEVGSNMIDLLRSKPISLMRVGAHDFGSGVATLDGFPAQYVFINFKASGNNYKRGLTIWVFYDSGADEYIVRGVVTINLNPKDVGNYTGVQASNLHAVIEDITDGVKMVQPKPAPKLGVNMFKNPASLFKFIQD